MAKWEYMRFRVYNSTTMGLKSGMFVSRADKINLEWIPKQFPSTKIKMQNDGNAIEVIPGGGEWSKVYSAVTDYLGSEGWEPFAVETEGGNTTLHFKRSS